MGDQLTVEQARNVIKSRVNATSSVDALGLKPAIYVTGMQNVLLQVCSYFC